MASDFSAVLRRLRARAGMTQEELARRSGLAERTILSLETDLLFNPRLVTVQALAEALALHPEDREALLSSAANEDLTASLRNVLAPERDALSGMARLLARAVAARWRDEEAWWRIQDPFPMPVRFRAAPDQLTDRWPAIRVLGANATATPLDLSGGLVDIVEIYRRIPSGRLVVLGRPGSGKSILTRRFVLDQLAALEPTEPVPVIFSISGWNPGTQALGDWLVDQLVRDHPFLAAPAPGGGSLASALVYAVRILPVLDGFDEMAEGLRGLALVMLNTTSFPLVLTSRSAEYARAVEETEKVLHAAAVIELTDLDLDDVGDYLIRNSPRASSTNPAETAWAVVLRALHEEPASPLATVLRNPLMVSLASTIYSDAPGHDPSALLDTERLDSEGALEEHLLDSFIATAYRTRPDDGRRGWPHRGFAPERARHWLGYLARHLRQRDTSDLAWWHLGSTVSRFSRLCVIAVLTALVVGVTTGLGTIVMDLIAASHGFGYVLERGLVTGLLHGGVAGLGSAIMYGAIGASRAAEPICLRSPIREGPRTAWSTRFRPGFALGLVLGLLAALVPVLMNRIAFVGFGLDDRLSDVLVFTPGVALGTGLLFGLTALLKAPIDISSAAGPADLLRENRRFVLIPLLVWGPVFGLVAGSLNLFTAGSAAGLTAGLQTALGLTLGYWFSSTAWGQWVALARVWLPLTGRLPWALITFLDDAHHRGILRQAGAVYQFRHARLQDSLSRSFGRKQVPRQVPEDLFPADGTLTGSSGETALSRDDQALGAPSPGDLLASHAVLVARILDEASHELEGVEPSTSGQAQAQVLDPDEARRLATDAREAVNNDLVALFLELGLPPEAAGTDDHEPINSGGGGTRA
ncbi:helix-turn-helix domain-containing protein [Streptomyces sp. NPDC057966]|uniref:helix-turn-helix domain-containing protein n=1 Tax=Streptomyces sp. NPDC057966 TaxID=3346292 RepID=UPI0036EE48A8